ncbi:LytR/AlgR family response regulator transcription factor [Moheibacter sediminis]|uniref:Two component transcriptional regulator, LytTR family n=1 Tax=Moheibacter sediminis TaxID=1434700 RepID=A0A1W1Z4W2_9FLAO|nr:LytTR family DNA-binding domain-containing protein [Moheibacter sediminis]SMC43433.1 two component transcriptional regulator, LytTR family [Moheibacter sediminis]
MNCIIVDDEPLAREEMVSLIEEISELKIIGNFSNAPAALNFMKSNQVNLIFLDIQMPEVTGIEFAQQLDQQTLIVFTTAFSNYAVKSYDLDAIDYLLKPIDKPRLEKAIQKAITYQNLLSENTLKNSVESSDKDFLLIKSDRRFYKIKFDDVKFIEGLKDYVVIHTTTQKLITAMNLKTIHQKIISDSFMRVSKSYIVNFNHIQSFDNHTIYIDESEIPLGEIFKAEFFAKYSVLD